MSGHSHGGPGDGANDGDSGVDDQIVGLAVHLINAQILQAQAEMAGDPLRARDVLARGYVLGVCDALCQAAGVEDEERCLALCMFVLVEIFGEQEGAGFGRLLLREMGRGESLRGHVTGGQDAVEWLGHQSDSAPPPTGLYVHITRGGA